MKYPFTPELLDALPEELAELYRSLEAKLLDSVLTRILQSAKPRIVSQSRLSNLALATSNSRSRACISWICVPDFGMVYLLQPCDYFSAIFVFCQHDKIRDCH